MPRSLLQPICRSLVACFILVSLIQVPALLAETPLEQIKVQVPLALKILDSYQNDSRVESNRTLHVVYWTPSDREPIPGYRERLSRVLLDIREFYRKEMLRLGFGDKTFDLEMENKDLVRLHLVRGRGPYSTYNVDSGNKIRDESIPTLEAAGVNAEKETVVIFCNMSNWDSTAMTMNQNSPYYAGGGLRRGIAWQVDSALLDPLKLNEKEPLIQDGQYGKISVGKYNSIFVGGVCHELGHALGLPHNRERPDEANAFGTSLMGSGNRTYGDDRRAEGRGSFLTLADGLRLASHPLFTKNEKGIDLKESVKVSDISVIPAKDSKSFVLKGRVAGSPPVYGVLGYLDPSGGGDYDAMTVTSIPDASGNFSLDCSTFKNGTSFVLRVVACQANGGRIDDKVLQVPFAVSKSGEVDIQSYIATLALQNLVYATQKNDANAAKKELARIKEKFSSKKQSSLLLAVADSLVKSIDFKVGPEPSLVKSDMCWLSEAKPVSAKVGWLKPYFNRLPNDSVVISIAGKLFVRGLYAHAPSEYIYDLNGKWNRLTGTAGLADGHAGLAVFVIMADGKELWQSGKVKEGDLKDFDLSVSNVKQLSLIVEDGGNGTNSDWGVWADVNLRR